jgi:RHS repeat-associated protein
MKPLLTYRPKSPGTNIGGYRYFFNGQEGDNEVFGEVANFGYEFRQYDSRLARWWGIDPKWNEYSGVSPYVFCNGSPIMLMDFKGTEAWKPEITESGDIRLNAEDGDNLNSLTEFLGGKNGIFSQRKIKKMWDERDSQDNVVLPENIFTTAIKNAHKLGYPSEDEIVQLSDMKFRQKGYKTNYNCFGAAISAACGDPIGEYKTNDLDAELEYGKWYSTITPVFGKTLIRFAKGKNASHAAIFFGKDHSGTTYVFTKNGYYSEPQIMELNQVENIPNYGPVTPLKTKTDRLKGDSGMYNYGKPKR